MNDEMNELKSVLKIFKSLRKTTVQRTIPSLMIFGFEEMMNDRNERKKLALPVPFLTSSENLKNLHFGRNIENSR